MQDLSSNKMEIRYLKINHCDFSIFVLYSVPSQLNITIDISYRHVHALWENLKKKKLALYQVLVLPTVLLYVVICFAKVFIYFLHFLRSQPKTLMYFIGIVFDRSTEISTYFWSCKSIPPFFFYK